MIEQRVAPVEYIVLDPRFDSNAPEHKNFVLPDYSREGDAAIDFIACINEPIVLKPGESVAIPAGFKMWLRNPALRAYLIPRSGLGINHRIVVGNLVGLVDSNFQGEPMVSVWNANPQVVWDFENNCARYNKEAEFTINPGDRVCQCEIGETIKGRLERVDEFEYETNRGTNGLGSSGLNAKSEEPFLITYTLTSISKVDGVHILRGHMPIGDKQVPVHIDVPVGTWTEEDLKDAYATLFNGGTLSFTVEHNPTVSSIVRISNGLQFAIPHPINSKFPIAAVTDELLTYCLPKSNIGFCIKVTSVDYYFNNATDSYAKKNEELTFHSYANGKGLAQVRHQIEGHLYANNNIHFTY